MTIRKAIIPAAGLGTRLLPSTKELPKEMLPIYTKSKDGSLTIKPLLQTIFEILYDTGLREFCFIIGRGKRAIEDHFTPDFSYLSLLEDRGKNKKAEELRSFYEKIQNSTLIWVQQDFPKGFGDAVLRAKTFAKDEPFLVYAGDILILSSKENYIKRLIEIYNQLHGDTIFLVSKVENPTIYGVVVPKEEIKNGVFLAEKVVEKPKKPPSNLAIMPIYVFDPIIFKALENLTPSERGEIELTDGIQRLIDWGFKVYAVELGSEGIWLDIGNPESYWKALKLSYEMVKKELPCPE